MQIRSRLVFCFGWFFLPGSLFAQEVAKSIGTLTRVEGTVTILKDPGATAKGPSPRAKYGNLYYTHQVAKVGDAVKDGNVVRTLPQSKALVVFENGDQFSVGPGTVYRIDSAGKRPEVQIEYGKFRGIVSKKGPRKRLVIRTKSATMGVRGTDFFIAERGKLGPTEVSVIRGEVEVTSKESRKRVLVKPGDSAMISRRLQKEKQVSLRPTTKYDLLEIQRASRIRVQKELNSSAVRSRVQTLEATAAKMTLTDIQSSDPQLYAAMKRKNQKRPDSANTYSVRAVFIKAPKGKPKKAQEMLKDDLENLEDDVYDRYFRID